MTKVIFAFSIELIEGAFAALFKSVISLVVVVIVGVVFLREPTKPQIIFDPPRLAEGVEFYALAGRCLWSLESVSDIECDGARYPGRDLIKAHLPASLTAKLQRGDDLVSIGAASFEGLLEVETRRAQNRAANMAQWVSDQLKIKGNIWVINMGQFLHNCPNCRVGDSSGQRPVILAIIGHQDDQEVVRMLVKDQLMSEANKSGSTIPYPDHYSQFKIQKLR